MHRAEKGHQADVCYEIHEQTSVHWTGCSEKRIKRSGNIDKTGSSLFG